jgi:hypothetical protein
MPRNIRGSSSAAGYDGVQPERRGGTGADNAQQALENLNGIRAALINRPGGVLGLDANGRTPDNTFESVAVDGDLVTQAGLWKEWFITTYDSLTNYTVTAIGGVVEREEHIIRYKADATVKPGGFIVNGRRISIEVIGDPEQEPSEPDPVVIAQPQIVGPVSGSTNVSERVTLYSTLFEVLQGVETHFSTDWEISTVPNFQTTVVASIGNRTNMTSFTTPNLSYNTQYYARVRHNGVLANSSSWSPTVSFKTREMPLPTNEVATIALPRTVGGVYTTQNEEYRMGVSVSDNGWMVVSNWVRSVAHILKYVNGSWSVVKEFDIGISANNTNRKFPRINPNGDFIIYVGSPGYDGGTSYVLQTLTRSGDTWTTRAPVSVSNPYSFGTMDVWPGPDQNSFTLITAGAGTSKITRHRKDEGVFWTLSMINQPVQTLDGSGEFRYMEVSKDNKTLVIVGSSTNLVRVYRRTSDSSDWVFAYAFPKTGYHNPNFSGMSLSADGRYFAITRPEFTGGGLAEIYELGTSAPVKLQTIYSDNTQNIGMFGTSVTMRDDGAVIVITESERTGGRSSDGIAHYVYLLEGGAWVLKKKVYFSDYAFATSATGSMALLGRLKLSGDGTELYSPFHTQGEGKLYIFK